MKQVRFDTPRRSDSRLRSCEAQMYESPDCHEPRALVDTRILPTPVVPRYPTERPTTYSSDPVERYELSDSTPYPTVSKTVLPNREKRPSEPSLELELSRLDGGESSLIANARRYSADSRPYRPADNIDRLGHFPNELSPSLKLTDNTLPNTFLIDARFKETPGPPNKTDDGGMFIHPKRPINTFTVPSWLQASKSVSHNVNPLKAKVDLANILNAKSFPSRNIVNNDNRKHCDCHECVPKYNKKNFSTYPLGDFQPHKLNHNRMPCCCPTQKKTDDILEPSLCSPCSVQPTTCSHQPAVQCRQYCSPPTREKQSPKCGTKPNCCHPEPSAPVTPINTVEAKTRAIEKYEQMSKTAESQVEKQTNVVKEQREPTVSDLFQIIKIQNEQLKLLQDRVDKLLVSSQHKLIDNTSTPFRPVQNFVQERVAVETLDENHHKISIGVMTSFEMVRTATKERTVKNTSQIQCNRSQVSIKEVIATAEQCNLNFLDGIAPVDQSFGQELNADANLLNDKGLNEQDDNYRTPLHRQSPYNGYEEKTLNELSLCNLQLDNAATPQLSPDQTIYLDVKDYSDSDNEDESGVGWTYYNKVMSHVNELLQESGVPSSAGALHRRAVAAAAAGAALGGVGAGAAHGGGAAGAGGEPRCTRLHVDRTDLSVTTSKRVTFGHHPAEAPKQFSRPVASSDTSLQMNRLAAKYLRKAKAEVRHAVQPLDVPLDMSLATRRYMEQHNLLQNGVPGLAPTMPVKFLDITALKQQPKLL